jgi:hypothetical protein
LTEIVALEALDADPETAIALVSEVCANRGTFNWAVCLQAANARLAGTLRYVDTGAPIPEPTLRLGYTQTSECFEVAFQVEEQPLSPRYRLAFEARDLAGRVGLLRGLVAFGGAAPRCVSVRRVQVESLWDTRDEDLWQQLNGPGVRTAPQRITTNPGDVLQGDEP